MDAAALRPLGIGEILDVSIKIFRSRFGTLVKAVAPVVVPISALTTLIDYSAPADDEVFVERQTAFGTEVSVDGDELAAFAVANAASILLTLLATLVATAATFKIVSAAYLGESTTWRDSLGFVGRRLASLVWLFVLSGVLLLIGLVLCIVPGIYLLVAWMVAVPVLLFEDVRGAKALGRSRRLVSGRWWATGIAMFVALLLTQVIELLLLGAFVGLILVGVSGVAETVVAIVVGAGSSILTTPFTASVLAVIYFDLRVRKEGFDIELLARRIGVDPSSGPLPDQATERRHDSGWPEPPIMPPGWDRPDA